MDSGQKTEIVVDSFTVRKLQVCCWCRMMVVDGVYIVTLEKINATVASLEPFGMWFSISAVRSVMYGLFSQQKIARLHVEHICAADSTQSHGKN